MSDTAAPGTTPATPGVSDEPGKVPATPAASPAGSDNSQDGKVTISTKEFAQLQRDAARARSFAKRAEIRKEQVRSQTTNADPDDPLLKEVETERAGRLQAENELHRERVINATRDILSKPEYANLPKSTRDLILKNPAALSKADNFDEAMLDVEDWIREAASVDAPAAPTKADRTPAGHETPPIVRSGTPAPVHAEDDEDISKLRGTDRSRAVLRNSLRAAKRNLT